MMSIFKNSAHHSLVENVKATDLSESDKKYVFFLQESKLFQLLKFVLVNNEEVFKVTKVDSASNEEITLIWIAYKKQDHKLLDLLLSVNSDVLKA